MNAPAANPFRDKRVCMVAPYRPRKGGVTEQTHLLVDALESYGVAVERVDTIVHILPGPLLAPLRILVQAAKTKLGLLRSGGKCDVIHVQACSYWGFLPVLVSVLVNRFYPRKRIVVTYHGGEAAAFMRKWGWLAAGMLRKADAVVAVSEPIRDALEARGVKCGLVHNLVDMSLFRFRERTVLEPKLVWVRYLEPTYDPLAALDVFERVKLEYPAATLTMVGDGSLRASIEQCTTKTGLTGVRLTGKLSPEQVAAELDAADIFLNTSKADGTPTAILEAMASGLPVATTNAGGVPQLVVSGVEGLVCDVGDVDALAAGVISLVKDPETAAGMSRQARMRAEEYSWNSVSGEIVELYGFVGGDN